MQKSESLLATETWLAERVRPYPGNPRTITDAAIAKVAASLRAFGWRQPIVVDAEGVIIVGHARLLAALSLGWGEVPVHVATNLTPDEARAYRLADNRTNEEAKWEPSKLAVDLELLAGVGFDMELTGFDPAELPTFEPPSFAPISAGEVKPLDQRAPVKCPACGEEFQP